MMDDAELLRRYVVEHSQESFTALVQKHLNLVYSAALRQVRGDRQAAEDVAQAVFTDLARKASMLQRHSALTGWLYTSTRYAATKVLRSSIRRQAREQVASTWEDGTPQPDWDQVRPVLDEAMHDLKERDRQAVLFRFFEQRSLAEVGEKLGISENAARKTVDRALERLRLVLARRGVGSTAAATALMLANQAVFAAPAGLATTISSAAIAAPAVAAGPFAFLHALSVSKSTLAAATIVLAGVAGLIHQQQVIHQLRQEVAELRTKSPAEPSATITGPSMPDPSPSTPANASVPATDEPASHPAAPADLLRMRYVNTFANVGRATPEAAMETTYWARNQVKLADLSAAIAFDASSKPKAERLFGFLPEDLRKEYATPENVAAAMLADAPGPQAIEIVGQTQQGPDDVTLQVQFLDRAGAVTGVKNLAYHHASDGWKTVISDAWVHTARQILKNKPERLPGVNPTAAAQ